MGPTGSLLNQLALTGRSLILCDWLVECLLLQAYHVNRTMEIKAAATTHTDHQM